MERETFKEWLADRVGEGEARISRRELARRLAEKHPGEGDPESYRRSIRRILEGQRNPTQPTRDAIQEALEDDTAPSVEEERVTEEDAMEALARDPEILKALMPALRAVLARGRAS